MGKSIFITYTESTKVKGSYMKLEDYEIANNKLLRENGAECTVLLRKNGDFPLDKPGKIALYGSGARNTIKGGTGSGEVNSRFSVTIEQGLENAGFEITTKSWLDSYDQIKIDAKKQFIKDIHAEARKKLTFALFLAMGRVVPEPEYNLPLDGEGDTAVYVLSRISGEGSDRMTDEGDVTLSQTEKRDILECCQKYKKFILVLNVGGVIDLSGIEQVQNILLFSQLGVEGGDIFADILLGKSNPSGKLATTWSKISDYSSLGDFEKLNDNRYKEGIYVGYRYFDSIGKKALFPFGFGLSYSDFELGCVETSLEGQKVIVQCDVKNIGKFEGKEVLQVYVSKPQGKLDQPYQVLAAFSKSDRIKPGSTAKLEASFNLSDIASYDVQSASFVLEKGSYIIRVGNSSVDTKVSAFINVDNDVIVEKCKNVFGKVDFEDFKPDNYDKLDKNMTELSELIMSGKAWENAKNLTLEKDVIITKVNKYDMPEEIDDFISTLADEELALMNIGAFDPRGGIAGLIGNSSLTVAGAAGETTVQLSNKGIGSIVMADGPAGMRLSKDYYTDEKGVHSLGESLPESILEFMPKIAKPFMSKGGGKAPEGKEVLHHWATAIPIGTAIAQTWNIDFAQQCGKMVGEDMDRFGVHLWLAPALNIHRDIRCGRNFEYFSEDPLISGKMAAAITNGVQAKKNCGTTIKHFAANNQELNRYNNNSIVSERAMREIYLKGFEIAVKESQACAVMTSYNLLNGIHTSESKELIQDVLRSEWGFKGIVMTDWVVSDMMASKGSIHPNAKAPKVAKAGGDLFMPGSKSNVKQVLKALKKGLISRKQLEINATRVYRMISKFKI
ncbi:MAG: glycoside hydrolase family 3 N-terminal domain-containing protein [Spirochaetales bacterium]|nr:glycoside hydrolase family 3 N-terminal domain-containing protein [Spirochaetales bacterium]